MTPPTEREFDQLSQSVRDIRDDMKEISKGLDAIQATLNQQNGALAVWKFLWGFLATGGVALAGWVAKVTGSHS